MREASGKRKQQALVTSECRKERNKEEERLKKKKVQEFDSGSYLRKVNEK